MFSFTARKTLVEAQPYIRRLCDLTTPNLAAPGELLRSENRYNRSLPALLCPWRKDRLALDEHRFALTKDVADLGVGLVLREPFHADEVMIGFWLPREEMSEPWFFRGAARRSAPLGGGFHLLGVELLEYANDNWRLELEPLASLANQLLPPGADL